MLLGRKTSDASLRMGAKFPSEGRYIVVSRDARPPMHRQTWSS
jgi:hypothetical protein